MSKKSGFTLVELLVVIAIIAILMVTVVVTLNPGQLLAQSRDSNRLSDLATLKTAILLFTTDTTATLGTRGTCYTYMESSIATTSCYWFTTASTTINISSSRNIDGTGWIPINFQSISAGTPLRQLPVDPVSNSTSTFYSYAASGTSLFKLAVNMESAKFAASGTSDVVSTDGGTSNTTYEIGPGILVL